MGTCYGYIRVSTREQNEDRQVVALQEMGIQEQHIYMDKQSGKDFNRPMYQKLIKTVREDDLIFVKSIDRLGRNYDDILEQWRILTKEKGVDIVVLDMPLLDTRRGKDLMGTFLSDIVLQVLSFVAENEHSNILQRQAEGILAAKARGVRFGRPPRPLPENFPLIYQQWRSGKLTGLAAAKACGMHGAEVIRRRKELTKCRCDLDVGDNPNTAIPILKVLLKRYTAKMRHYYLLADRDDFHIASIRHRPERRIGNDQYHVVALKSIEEVRHRFQPERFAESTPYKDTWYIGHRFFHHPIYQYQVYGIERVPGIADAIIVFRNQEYQDRIAIRMVDYIGERSAIAGIGHFLESMLEQDAAAEYIDFYCAGMEEERILDAGFAVLSEDDENIIPNYFAPFLQKNIDIWVDSRDENSLFTKADADQDRPNAAPV